MEPLTLSVPSIGNAQSHSFPVLSVKFASTLPQLQVSGETPTLRFADVTASNVTLISVLRKEPIQFTSFPDIWRKTSAVLFSSQQQSSLPKPAPLTSALPLHRPNPQVEHDNKLLKSARQEAVNAFGLL